MSKRIVGVSPWSPRDGVDYDLMKAAGIEWVRQNSEFPFGRSEEDITPSYTRWFDRYKEAKAAGMKQACVSPIRRASATTRKPASARPTARFPTGRAPLTATGSTR